MAMNKDILGIHYGHDATATLMRNGVIVESMSEERLSRFKKHGGFPALSVAYIKEKYHIDTFTNVAVVGVTPEMNAEISLKDNQKRRASMRQKPKYFKRAVATSFGLPALLLKWRDNWRVSRIQKAQAINNKKFLETQFPEADIKYVDHHLAHAWAIVPFIDKQASPRVLLTLDGAGDDLSGSVCLYEDGRIERKHSTPVSASLGLLYASVVDFLGMSRNEHEFKVMGLAPYAKPSAGDEVYKKLQQMIWFDREDMRCKSAFNMEQATPELIRQDFCNHRFDAIAYGIQKLAETIMIEIVEAATQKYNLKDIGVAGGVFMNVKANQRILESDLVDSFTIAPSGGDESLSMGAAVALYAEQNNFDTKTYPQLDNIYLGSEYTDEEIKSVIDFKAEEYTVTKFDDKSGQTIEAAVAELLSQNSVVGRFSGRAEWGARALGNRSILANPTSRDNVKLINEMIKGRDFWMPFATSVVKESAEEYLIDVNKVDAKYMHITFETTSKAHADLLAALHPYDLTSRPQVVTAESNPTYHALISEFKNLTGVGGVLNTSFNLHGEPNVEKPADALHTFLRSGLPHLALGKYLLSKKNSEMKRI